MPDAFKWIGGALLGALFTGLATNPPADRPAAPAASDSPPPPASATPSPSPSPELAAAPALTTVQRDQCRQFLAQAADAGMVASRPTPTRLNVNEAQWAIADAETKRVLLQAVACDVWGRHLPTALDHVVAYGQHSGQRLAMLTEVGIRFE